MSLERRSQILEAGLKLTSRPESWLNELRSDFFAVKIALN